MSSFEEITAALIDYEYDREFSKVIDYAISINEFYRSRGTPVNYEEALADLDALNRKWANLNVDEPVEVSGEIILNQDPLTHEEVFHGNDESVLELDSYTLRSGKFVLHDTLQFDGSNIVSGIQEIKFAGMVDVADLIGDMTEPLIDDDDESEFDIVDNSDDEAEEVEEEFVGNRNQGWVWGLVSLGQIAPRLISINPELAEARELLSESCRKHFDRIRTLLEKTDDHGEQLSGLSDLEYIPEYQEAAIAAYREVLETYVNDALAFEENIPYILQTNGQYMRQVFQNDLGDFVPVDAQNPIDVAIINPKVCLAYDEVGLPALFVRAYDLFAKKGGVSAFLSIPLRSIIAMESTESMLQTRLKQQDE